jgi:tRNA (guanine-N7-)-methyltransferase
VGKGKLSKFEEMKTFKNVFQPSLDEIFNKDFHLKNSWKQEHFGNENPIVLELGCGKGEYSVGLASKFPDRNFIGVDIKGARIWTGARQALSQEIPNVAFIRARIEFITSFFGPGEVDEIWLTFPDPQLKKRRNKKRLTASRFLNSYREFLADGGIIHLKTDNAELYKYTLDLLRGNNLQEEIATADLYGDKQDELVHGIKTYYENQFIEIGLNIHYLRFRLPADKIITEPEIEDDQP